MTELECGNCGKPIEDDENLIGYDDLPFHRDCIKEMFREDNPELSEEKYKEFDQAAGLVDKFEKDGNVLIPVIHEINEVQSE